MRVNTMIFTKIVIVMALACATLADETTTETAAETTDTTEVNCWTRTDCETCTAAVTDDADYGDEDYGGACWWSSERQACLQPTPSYSDAAGSEEEEEENEEEAATEAARQEALVHDPADCPRLWVVDGGRAFAGEPFAYRVNVTNDAVAGLVPYMSRVGVTCLTDDGGRLAGRAVANTAGDGGHVACDPVTRGRRRSEDDGGPWSMSVGHYYVVFGPHNATLRLEHEMDYYASFYDRDCATVGDEGDGGYVNGCVDCAWTAHHYRHYVKRCSTRNQCVGPFEYYDRRFVNGMDSHVTSWARGERTECERAITVESFEPTHVPWTTTVVNVTVVIRNHRVLVEGATVNVTVAGRACEDPRTSAEEEDTVRCTVTTDASLVAAAVGAVGPVRVTYTATRDLAVESAEEFQFIAPNVTAVEGPSCGPMGGGTALAVLGTGFNASGSVRVYIQWADGATVPCRVIRVLDNHIRCSTVARPGPTGHGRVRVDFDGSASVWAPGRGFAYAHMPRPFPDDGQRLSGIASGGTSVPVRWHGIECLRGDSVVAFFVYPHRERRKCSVRNDTLVCVSPSLADLVNKEGQRRDGRPAAAATAGGPTRDSPIAVLRCDFSVRFGGGAMHHPCPEAGYAVYADPAFEDFEVDVRGKVVVYGRGELGLGWDETDVYVEFRGGREGECHVEWLARDRVVCAVDARTTAWLFTAGPHEAKVRVGYAEAVMVPQRPRGRGAALRDDRTFVGFMVDNAAAALAVVSAAALLASVGFFVLLRRSKRRAAARRFTDVVRLSDLTNDDDDVAIFSAS